MTPEQWGLMGWLLFVGFSAFVFGFSLGATVVSNHTKAMAVKTGVMEVDGEVWKVTK